MKFAFFGYDYSLDIATRLIEEGHELIHIFTFECDNHFSFNTTIKNFASQHNIAISDKPPQIQDLNKLIEQGCNLLLSAGYPHKLPIVDQTKCYSLNMHPSLLPRARGVMPLPYIILKEQNAAGFTVHRHSPGFDEGDILYQQKIPINEHTDIETLSAQIAIHAPDALAEIVNNLKHYWENAKPQNTQDASYYNQPSRDMRTINWDQSTISIKKQSNAFGRFGILAKVQNNLGETQTLAVFQLTCWQDKHTRKNGELIRSSPREVIIAVHDGYICIKEFEIIE